MDFTVPPGKLSRKALVTWLAAAGMAVGAVEPSLPHRWFFAFGHERTPEGVGEIKKLIDRGVAHGLNGMVLSSFGLDEMSRWREEDYALLRGVAEHCERRGVELIPTGLSVGYGSGALRQDRNFAAAVPVRMSLRAEGGVIRPWPGEELFVNGGLEEHQGSQFPGYRFHDRPGEVTFADTVSGSTCMRFENFGNFEHGHGRLAQNVGVAPGRSYRLSLRIKTEGLDPVSGLKAMVLGDGRSLADTPMPVKTTQDWTEVELDYHNGERQSVVVYAGIWGGKAGKFWIDDLRFREYGDLGDIVRREGTPLELHSAEREVVFAEEKDYEAIRCSPDLKGLDIPGGSSIRDGERLELRCYKIPYASHPWGKQISLCMSHPPLYEYWEAELRRLHREVPFKKFLLSMDEIRNGGGCELCRNSGKSMAEILGNCITRQRAMLKALDPEIEVLIWSDMLDPAHNARNHYYGVVGDFTGSWKHVPRDVVMMCWSEDILEKSLGFFSKEGFGTFGAAYYDAEDLVGSRTWLGALRRTPGARGIMYTTWEKKYGLLDAFGDLVGGSGKSAEMPHGPGRAGSD
jgi:hypothetical protein